MQSKVRHAHVYTHHVFVMFFPPSALYFTMLPIPCAPYPRSLTSILSTTLQPHPHSQPHLPVTSPCPAPHPLFQNTSQIFPPTTGGAEQMCAELNLPLLGRVPLDPRIGRSCDEGKSFLSEIPDSPAAAAYLSIVHSEYTRTHTGVCTCASRHVRAYRAMH